MTFLNIALLTIGTMATLAAFGGKTWTEGSEPILKRVTPRGWLSLMCLLLAFFIGTFKEVLSKRDDYAKKLAADADKAALAAQLSSSQYQLQLAKKDLDSLDQKAALTQDRLNDTKSTLVSVRKDLDAARSDLSLQSASSLVTALANADRHIRDIAFFLPLTSAAHASPSIRDILLPVFHQGACSDLTGLALSIATNRDHQEFFIYPPGDRTSSHEYFSGEIQKQDSMSTFLDFDSIGNPNVIKNVTSMLGQSSSNGYLYSAYLHPTSNPISAADFYAIIMQPGAQIITISTSWPTPFLTIQSYESAVERYPEFLDKRVTISQINLDGLSPVRFPYPRVPYPSECLGQVHQYFQTAFQKALLVVNLDGGDNETLMFNLRATAPRLVDGMWLVALVPQGSPSVVAMGAKGLSALHSWPAAQKLSEPK